MSLEKFPDDIGRVQTVARLADPFSGSRFLPPATAVANIVAATIVAIQDLRILGVPEAPVQCTPRMMRGFRMQLDF
jgi:hypothetical protein